MKCNHSYWHNKIGCEEKFVKPKDSYKFAGKVKGMEGIKIKKVERRFN